MTAYIGDIALQFIEGKAIQAKGTIANQEIPLSTTLAYKRGAPPSTLRITSAFYDSVSDEEAGRLRRQLNEMVRNPNEEGYYIQFAKDQDEFNGWYLIQDLDTEYPPASFGDYPFTMTAIRMAGTQHVIGVYWDNEAITNHWSLAGIKKVALPGGAKISGTVSGLEGTNGKHNSTDFVFRKVTDPDSNVMYIELDSSGDVIEGNKSVSTKDICQAWAYTSRDDPTPERVYSADGLAHLDLEVSNGLVRVYAEKKSDGYGHTITLDAWSHNLQVWFPCGQIVFAEALGVSAGQHLSIKRVTTEEVEFNVTVSMNAITDSKMIVECRLQRGRQYISCEAVGSSHTAMLTDAHIKPIDLSSGPFRNDVNIESSFPSNIRNSVVHHFVNADGAAVPNSPATTFGSPTSKNWTAAILNTGAMFGWAMVSTPTGLDMPAPNSDNELHYSVNHSVGDRAKFAFFGGIINLVASTSGVSLHSDDNTTIAGATPDEIASMRVADSGIAYLSLSANAHEATITFPGGLDSFIFSNHLIFTFTIEARGNIDDDNLPILRVKNSSIVDSPVNAYTVGRKPIANVIIDLDPPAPSAYKFFFDGDLPTGAQVWISQVSYISYPEDSPDFIPAWREIGEEYLANVSQKTTLLRPEWMRSD